MASSSQSMYPIEIPLTISPAMASSSGHRNPRAAIFGARTEPKCLFIDLGAGAGSDLEAEKTTEFFGFSEDFSMGQMVLKDDD